MSNAGLAAAIIEAAKQDPTFESNVKLASIQFLRSLGAFNVSANAATDKLTGALANSITTIDAEIKRALSAEVDAGATLLACERAREECNTTMKEMLDTHSKYVTAAEESVFEAAQEYARQIGKLEKEVFAATSQALDCETRRDTQSADIVLLKRQLQSIENNLQSDTMFTNDQLAELRRMVSKLTERERELEKNLKEAVIESNRLKQALNDERQEKNAMRNVLKEAKAIQKTPPRWSMLLAAKDLALLLSLALNVFLAMQSFDDTVRRVQERHQPQDLSEALRLGYDLALEGKLGSPFADVLGALGFQAS